MEGSIGRERRILETCLGSLWGRLIWCIHRRVFFDHFRETPVFWDLDRYRSPNQVPLEQTPFLPLGKFMRYLYFQPRAAPAANSIWPSYQRTIISKLDNCSKLQELNQIHAQLTRTCLYQDTSVATRLINLYTHFSINYAHCIFNQLDHPNLLNWNSIIRGYTHNGAPTEALFLFKQMLFRGYSPDDYTYPIVIKASSHIHGLGETIHGQVLKGGFESNMIIMSGFLAFYVNCGRIGIARKVFDEMRERDVVSWTTMVSGYSQQCLSEEAFLLFDEMRRKGVVPNEVTVVSLLSGSGNVGDLDRGKWLHSYIVNQDIRIDGVVGNALMNMYAKCGCMSSASEVFNNMSTVNAVSWNILIGGFTQNGHPVEALKLFRNMEKSDVKPNEITLVNTLSACAQLGDHEQGKLLHSYVAETVLNYSVLIGNALINMYCKCADLDGAACVFHQMPDKDIFSWTALVTGYVQGSKCKEALALFQEMQLAGAEPNEVTLAGLLSACAQLGSLDQGKLIHAYIVEHKVRQDVFLRTALVDMYVKCGCIADALQIFHCMPRKDTSTWNALIGGLAMHGYGREAIILFIQMLKVGDSAPDHVTFTTVLCACTHSGLVREGFYFFNFMSSLYGTRPTIEHYGCMVDLLGRAGRLEEADEFIEKMPVEPNHIIWAALLSACCANQKVETAEKAAQNILKLAPDDEGVYVLLSNLYADVGRWDEVKRVRALMGNRGIEKSPGYSLIEVAGVVQEFHVRGLMHPESIRIYLTLDSLLLQSKEAVFISCEQDALTCDYKDGKCPHY